MSLRNWSVGPHLVQMDRLRHIMEDFYSGGAILRAKEFLIHLHASPTALLNSCLEQLSSHQKDHLSSTRTLLELIPLFTTSKSLLII